MLIILAMMWLQNLKDQENKPLWLHLEEGFCFFFSFFFFSFPFLKFSLLLKNANFLLSLLGPESLLSGGSEQRLSNVSAVGLKLNLQLKTQHKG